MRSLSPDDEVPVGAVADQHCGPDFLAVAHEGVVVGRAVGLDAVPAVGLGLPAAAGHPVEARREVLAEPEQEGFRGADAVPGEGVDGVLLRVRGHHVAVVAFEVGRREVAAELRGDVEVFDLVALSVAGDLDDADFGFTVLVLSEDDPVVHGVVPNFRYVEPKSHIEISYAFRVRFLLRRPTKKSRRQLTPAHYNPACCSQVT